MPSPLVGGGLLPAASTSKARASAHVGWWSSALPPPPFPPPAQSVVTFSMSVSLHGGSPDVSVVEVRRGRGPARVWHEWKYCFYAVAMLLLPPVAACPPPLGHANAVGPTIVFHEVYRTLLQKLSGMLATIN